MIYFRRVILFFTTLSFSVMHCQDQFTIDELGLSPKSITTTIEQSSKQELYSKTLAWLKGRNESHNLSVEDKSDSHTINFTFIKGNAVSLDKQYYKAKYHVTLNFIDGSYTFKPTKIELKLNSKYDMGWKEFNLNTGAMFYRRGKVIRKYKRYLRDLTAPLNEFRNQLHAHLKGG
ncbi:DUF4468 domain-containing protein [uncultured Winogradskyella sp.]|uniref:DUF4468 domain-containing protein n=1 Tax=uncultured Winogradskyella sp. TaxID=395353 RepID=UPI00351460FD